MTNSSTIINAAALIADIDPALAKAFLAQRFNRHSLITALHRGMSKSKSFAHIADPTATALRAAVDFDAKEFAQ